MKRSKESAVLNVAGFYRKQQELLLVPREPAAECVAEMAALSLGLRDALSKSVPPHLVQQLPQRVETTCFEVAGRIWDILVSRGEPPAPANLETATQGISSVTERQIESAGARVGRSGRSR